MYKYSESFYNCVCQIFCFPLYHRTPLDLAAEKGHKDIVEYLSTLGVSIWDWVVAVYIKKLSHHHHD